jgi:hypothetical protein
MEYCPVAINEVLAYSWNSGTGNAQTNRFFLELINTLTRSNATYNPTTLYPSAGLTAPINTSDLDLNGWDIVIAPDDPTNRPDPTTGQFMEASAGFHTTPYGPIPLYVPTGASRSTGLSKDVVLSALTSAAGTSGKPDTGNTSNYYYVLSNQPPADPQDEVGAPAVGATTGPRVN